MSFVEIERGDGIMVVRLNRPERMNSLGTELRNLLADAWCEFRDSKDLEVAIFTGTGRAFTTGRCVATWRHSERACQAMSGASWRAK